MYPFKFFNLDSFQLSSWTKPTYLPDLYRGIAAFLIVNLCLMLVVKYMIHRRLAVFAAEHLQV